MNEWKKNEQIEQIEQVEQTQEREQNESIPKITTLKCGWKNWISWTNQKNVLLKDRIQEIDNWIQIERNIFKKLKKEFSSD